MSARGLSAESSRHAKAVACRSCNRRRKVLESEFCFVDHALEDGLTSDDLASIQALLTEVTPKTWFDMLIDDIPIGRYAAYEFFLTYKLNSHVIPAELWDTYLGHLKNALIAHAAMTRLFDSVKFDAILVYNGLYSTNRVVTKLGQQRGIPSWAMHAGSHVVDKFCTLCMYDADLLPVLSFKSDEWSRIREIPLCPDDVQLVQRHIAEIVRGRNLFVYSTGVGRITQVELRERLGIPTDRKVLLATMSSGDEIVAARLVGLFPEVPDTSSVFENAADWIRFLVKECEQRPDLHLVVRVHPREFPNKREGQRSQNSYELEHVLSNLPSNVTVNWPSDEISLYDLIPVVDVVLNSTSSAGLELSAFGLPVVLHDSQYMLAYDPGIHSIVRNRHDYMAAVDAAIREGRSLENSRRSFRWWAFVFRNLAVDISEGFSYPSNGYLIAENSVKARVVNTALGFAVRVAPPVREIRDARRRQPLVNGDVYDQAIVEGLDFALRLHEPTNRSIDVESEALEAAVDNLLKVLAGDVPD